MLERMWRKESPPPLLMGTKIGNSHYGEQYGQSSEN